MNYEHPTTSGGAAAAFAAFDLGAILGGPFRDPRALQKFLGGCLAVIGIAFFGLGLLALLGFSFQTTQRARQGEEHPMPEWTDIRRLLRDGLRVLGVVLGYLLPALVLAILSFLSVLGETANAVLGPLSFLLGLLGTVLTPIAIVRMVASNEIGSAFRIQENLRLIQSHLGVYGVFLLIALVINLLEAVSAMPCVIGLILGLFWSQAATGMALGRLSRVMGI